MRRLFAHARFLLAVLMMMRLSVAQHALWQRMPRRADRRRGIAVALALWLRVLTGLDFRDLSVGGDLG
jgi:hypothetical protein